MAPKGKQKAPQKTICPACGELYGPEDEQCPVDGAVLEPAKDPHAGTKVGSYVLIRRLGKGGTGSVYLAIHPDIGSRVAIKILSEDAAEDRMQLERFLTEAQAVNRIEHPNIVKILDKGELEDGRPYILMELLEGASLKDRLREGPELGMEETKGIVLQVLDALQAAHEAGFIHRDLKPENIYITKEGQAKLVDFGIAKLMDKEGATGLTQTGTILGTPLYLAPEQASGQNSRVGPQTDVYCMGVILYELYTGSLPFNSKNVYKVITAHINNEPPPPRERNSLISHELEELILWCLEKDPSDRPSTAAELTKAYLGAHDGFAQGLEDTLSEGTQLSGGTSQKFKTIPGRKANTAAIPLRDKPPSKAPNSSTWRSTSGQNMSSAKKPPQEDKGGGLSKKKVFIGLTAVVSVVALLALAFFFRGEDKDRPPQKTPSKAGVGPTGSLIVLQKKDTESLLPTEVERTPSINILSNVFEPLVVFDPLTGAIKPWLAKSWKPSKNGYHFTLVKGVTFQDGTPLTAKRVVESLRRSLKSDLGKTYFWDVEGLKPLDDGRFEISLSQPSGSFLTRLSLWPAFITIPKKPFPVGTGPFKIKSWNVQMGAVVLEASKGYWGVPPKIKRLVFRASADSSAQASMLLQGDAHLATALSPEAASKLEKKDSVHVFKTATNVAVYLFFNTKKPYLASREVRIALSKAVPISKLLSDLYNQAARRAKGSLPPVLSAARVVKGGGPPRYAPQEAKAALKGKKLKDTTLSIYLPSQPRSSVPDPQKMGRLLVEGFAAAGVEAKAVYLPSKEFYAACARGDHDLAVFGWIPDYPDPENVYFLLSSQGTKAGYNLALYHDETYEKLMSNARTERNPEKRRALFYKMEKHLKEARPWVPLVHVAGFVGVRNEVKGLKLGVEQCLGGADLFLRGAYLEKEK